VINVHHFSHNCRNCRLENKAKSNVEKIPHSILPKARSLPDATFTLLIAETSVAGFGRFKGRKPLLETLKKT
jgi:hypothetical protein